MIGAEVRCAARGLPHAHRLSDRYLAARRRRPGNSRPRLLALPRGSRARRPCRHHGRRRTDGEAVRGGGRLEAPAIPRSATDKWRSGALVLLAEPTSSMRRPRTQPPRRLHCSLRRPSWRSFVSDPAYERARHGVFSGTLEEFRARGRGRCAPSRRSLRLAARRARTIVAPSAYLAEIAGSWGLPRRPHSRSLLNPAPPPRNVEAELPRAPSCSWAG